jgi:hypothetical protein
MKQRVLAVVLFVLAICLIPASRVALGVLASDDPVLVNPGFEGNFTFRGAPEVEVAVGWDPAWIQGDDRQCRAPCYRPEYKPERTIKVQGETSQRWFTTFARQFAAIYQRVDVEPGQWYEFSCDVYAISEPNGQMGAFVGINPWGGDAFHRTMIWGQEQVAPGGGWVYRQWTRVSVTAQAWSDRITVACGGNNSFATHNNAVYWYNCSIRRVDDKAPSTGQTPLPTYTPYPTYTPQPTWTPPAPCPTCPTTTPCPTGTPCPEQTPCPTSVPETGSDCPTIDEIRAAVETVVAERPPVRWPR